MILQVPDITLVGKGYTGFGESINENFVKMLENFANSSFPKKKKKNLLDKFGGIQVYPRLKVYTGTNWTTGGGFTRRHTACNGCW